MLKQASFTFTVPPKAQNEPSTSTPKHFSSDSPIFSASPPSSVISPEGSHITPKPSNPLDWTSLTSFDPSMLNLLDESPQTTATASGMDLDLFGDQNTGLASDSPFTTIASNPTFMSFASSFDTMTTPMETQPSISNGNNNNRSNGQQPFSFDMNTMSWPTPTPPSQDASIDDLFAGYLNPNQNIDFSSPFASTSSISPITHQATINTANFANLNSSHLSSLSLQKGSSHASRTSSIPSPSSQSTASSEPSLRTPKENSSASASPKSDHPVGVNDPSFDQVLHDKTQCPKTKLELTRRIAEAGASPFARSGVQKSSEPGAGPMVNCVGSKFPRTAQNDKNVEVLKAWRSITSNPVFKVGLGLLNR